MPDRGVERARKHMIRPADDDVTHVGHTPIPSQALEFLTVAHRNDQIVAALHQGERHAQRADVATRHRRMSLRTA